MPTTLSIVEGEPATWPQIDPTDEAAAVPAVAEADEPALRNFTRAAWQRVQGWIAYRWNVRSCVFVVEGPGDWVAPLQPFTATSFQQWLDNSWSAVTLAPTALGGYVLDAVGPYRFTGNLGAATAPPEAVRQAVWRLATFFEAAEAVPAEERALTGYKFTLHGLTEERERNANWIARAMQQSGAGDLLRPWRKLGAR